MAVQTQPVYVLTALAVAPTSTSANKARRMVQYEVAKVDLPPIPSALTLAGPIDPAKIGFPNSNNYVVDGHNGTDPNTGLPCGPDKPAIGTVTDVGTGGANPETPLQVATDGRNNVITALPRPNHYTGVDACTGNQPDVQNITNTVNPDYSTVSGLNAVVHSVQNAATQTLSCPSGVCTPPTSLGDSSATPPFLPVTVANGDLTLSGRTSGAGILLVTGTLTLSGNFSFDGLILVVGNGVLNANGGGNGQMNGAIVVANIGNSSYATNPTDANLLSQLGSPTFNFNGGGGNGLHYNSCNINLSATAASYTVISRREITY